MIGQTLGHYRIVEKIGAGGMGVVYRARDERLNRDVALKVLPVEMLAEATAVKSFREEAQALSKLNHPNIATIFDFDFDSESGVELIAMEFVPGETLAERARGGLMAEKEAIALALQIADALEAGTEGIGRTSTVIALATQVPHRVLPLVRAAARLSAGRG